MDQREFAQALANGARYSAEQKAHREEVERLKAINTELLGALERWMVLYESGYQHRGVGVGSIRIRKWDADEAKFYTRDAIAKARGQS